MKKIPLLLTSILLLAACDFNSPSFDKDKLNSLPVGLAQQLTELEHISELEARHYLANLFICQMMSKDYIKDNLKIRKLYQFSLESKTCGRDIAVYNHCLFDNFLEELSTPSKDEVIKVCGKPDFGKNEWEGCSAKKEVYFERYIEPIVGGKLKPEYELRRLTGESEEQFRKIYFAEHCGYTQ